MFMAGLCLLKEGETICLRAAQSKDKNNFGKYTTFINWMVYDAVTRIWTEIRPDANKEGQTWKDRLDDVREEFEALPLYKERESGSSGKEATEFDLFCQTVDGKGWKPVKANPADYLAWINQATSESHTSLDAVPEDDWTELRQLVGMAKKVPPSLVA